MKFPPSHILSIKTREEMYALILAFDAKEHHIFLLSIPLKRDLFHVPLKGKPTHGLHAAVHIDCRHN